VRLGHRSIAFLDTGRVLAPDNPIGTLDPKRDSLLGYRAGLQESRIDREWLLAIPDFPDLEHWQENEERSVRAHLERWGEVPSAILCAYDFRAGPLFRVLRERGLRIPQDVSVMGMGDTPWAIALDPMLTSVCLGESQMARLALVLNEEPEPPTPRVIRVDPELVERQSVAEAP
jgi:LacI family transcriptional regulator